MMPRPVCAVLGCGERPILELPGRLLAAWPITLEAGDRLQHCGGARLCVEHAAECGVAQLPLPGVEREPVTA